MLAGLLERTVGAGNDQDSAVHLGSTGDHVLNIVGVTGAVNVSIVTVCSLILNVTGVDCNTSRSFLGSVVDLVICHKFDLIVAESKILCNGSGQSGLTMVNVTDGTNVYVGFGAFKCGLSHFWNPPANCFCFLF